MAISDLNITIDEYNTGSYSYMVEGMEASEIEEMGGAEKYVRSYVNGMLDGVQSNVAANHGKTYAHSTLLKELRANGEIKRAIAWVSDWVERQ